MSAMYDDFKSRTIKASDTIQQANEMRAVSDDFRDGFDKAMWEAREIFMRVEDSYTITAIVEE